MSMELTTHPAQAVNDAIRVAVLGLGLMGAGMARCLIAAGYSVAVYNRNPERAAPFAGSARVASSPRDAVQGADFVVSMVADDGASRGVWAGEQGAFAGVRPGTICIESSTVTPAWIGQWAELASSVQCAAIDAPVTGSRAQAESGELNFLVGGAPSAIERARPLFECMGKSVVPLGAVGSGATFKLINNFLCGVQLASLSQAMAMIDRSGLDRTTAVATLLAGAPGSPLVKAVSARMVEDNYTPNFLVRLMAKDLAYAGELARAMDLDLTTAQSAQALFAAADTAGFGEQDIAAVYKYVRGDAGASSAS